MALSWIFGGKKKEEKPIPVTVEAVEVGSDEDYAIIQANSSRTGIYPQVPYPTSQFYTQLPYSVLPRQQQPVAGTTVRAATHNQLEGVPFILSPLLDQGTTQNPLTGLEDLRRSVFQIAADVNDSVNDYDFKLEGTTVQEQSAFNHHS